MKRLAKLRNNKEVYNKEIKSLRKLLDDGEYTRVLPSGYHHFLSEMHRKLVGNERITPKMLSAVEQAIESYGNYNCPEDKTESIYRVQENTNFVMLVGVTKISLSI